MPSIDVPVFLLGLFKWLVVMVLASFAHDVDPTLLLVLMLCGAAQMGVSLISNPRTRA